jgi:tryptophanyl-tRNA synthetase
MSVLLGMITPLGWLFRCPTYKEQLTEIKDKDLHNLGFLGYPVLQAADITVYRAQAVPVGQDQLPHLELTREIVRRFNSLYGDVLPEPQAILTKSARVPGLDMRKMSKSYGNAITLDDEPETITTKLVKQAFTDPTRARATDPGHPDGCAVFAYHQLFNSAAAEREAECKAGTIGCVNCKKQCAELIANGLAPVREKRKAFAAQKDLVNDILRDGQKRAQAAAAQTMDLVRSAVKLK